MRLWPLCWVGLSACGVARLSLPDEGDARSVLLIGEGSEQVQFWAYDLPDAPIHVDVAADSTIWALLHGEQLFELGLDPGVQTIAAAGTPVTLGLRGYQSKAPNDPPAWVEIDALPEQLLALRLQTPPRARACFEAGGCLSPTGTCDVPCPPHDPPAPPSPPTLIESPPLAPEPPRLGPCADFQSLSRDGVMVCEPWPASGPLPCAVGEAQLPGTTGCAPIGRCQIGRFPTLPGAVNALYVDSQAAPGGDGSASSPFSTIGAAVTGAGNTPTAIAIARGRYAESVRIAAGAHIDLYGACAHETVIDAGAANSAVVVDGMAGVRDLSLIGSNGLIARGPSTLEGAIAVGTDSAVVAFASSAFVRGCVLSGGTGVTVRQAGHLDARRTLIGPVSDAGIRAVDASTATVADVAIRGVIRSGGGLGFGVELNSGASLSGGPLSIEDVDTIGLYVSEPGSSAVLDGLLLRELGVADRPGAGQGTGVRVEGGASVTLTRVEVRSARSHALCVQDEHSAASVTDVLIADIDPADSGNEAAVCASGQASAHLLRSKLVRAGRDGLRVSNGATLEAVDLAVLSPSRRGGCVWLEGGGELSLERTLLFGCAQLGLLVDGGGGRVSADELTVLGSTLAASSAEAGVSVAGGQVTLTRGLFAGLSLLGVDVSAGQLTGRDWWLRDIGVSGVSQTKGIRVAGGVALDLQRIQLDNAGCDGIDLITSDNAEISDLRITGVGPGVDPNPSGIEVGNAGRLTLDRAAITGFLSRALHVRSVASRITVHDLLVEGTLDTCAETECGIEPQGALCVERQGELTADRVWVKDSLVPALRIASGGLISVSNGTIERNVVGVSLDDPGYDFFKLTRGVSWLDNPTPVLSP